MSHLVSMGGGRKKGPAWATAQSAAAGGAEGGGAGGGGAGRVPSLDGKLPAPGDGGDDAGADGEGSSRELAPLGSKSARGAGALSSGLDALFGGEDDAGGAKSARHARGDVRPKSSKGKSRKAEPKKDAPAMMPLDFDDIENTSEEEINAPPAAGAMAAAGGAAPPTDSRATHARSMPHDLTKEPHVDARFADGKSSEAELQPAPDGSAETSMGNVLESGAPADSTASDLGLDVFGPGSAAGSKPSSAGERTGRRGGLPTFSPGDGASSLDKPLLKGVHSPPKASSAPASRSEPKPKSSADEWGDPLDMLGLGGDEPKNEESTLAEESEDLVAVGGYVPSFVPHAGQGRQRRQLGHSTTSSGASTARGTGSSGEDSLSLSARFTGARDGTKSASTSIAGTPREPSLKSESPRPEGAAKGAADEFTEELDDTDLDAARAPTEGARGVPGIDLGGGLGGGKPSLSSAREGDDGANGGSRDPAAVAGPSSGRRTSAPSTARTGGTSGRSYGGSARSLDSSLYSARTDATNDGGRMAIAAELAVVQEAHLKDVEAVKSAAAETEARLRAEMAELKEAIQSSIQASASGSGKNTEVAQMSQALLKERRLREMAEEGRARAEGERARAEALASSESRALEAERATTASIRSDLESTRLALSKAEARAATFEAELTLKGQEGSATADAAARHLEETQTHLATIASLRAELDAQRASHAREVDGLRAQNTRLTGQLAARSDELSAARKRHEGDVKHDNVLERVEALAVRVEGLAASAHKLSSNVSDAWADSMAAREKNVASLEGTMRSRLDEITRAEEAAVRAHADLAALGETLAAALREVQASGAAEKARLEREQARCDALVESLATERAQATAVLERERTALEAVRDRRQADHEAFFRELAESRSQLDRDRAAFDARRDASVKAEVDAAQKLADIEAKASVAQQKLAHDTLEAERMVSEATRARTEYESHRERAEREREDLASEAARLARLGAAVQAKSAEAAAALEVASRERRRADTAAAEAAADRVRAAEDRAAVDEAMASLAAQRKEADERRLAMADERGRLQEERLAASRAAEEARQAQLDAVKSREEALPGHPYSGWRERDHGARSTHQRPRRHKKASKGTDGLLAALGGDLSSLEAAATESEQYLSEQATFLGEMQAVIAGNASVPFVNASAPIAAAAVGETAAAPVVALDESTFLDRSSFTPLVQLSSEQPTFADTTQDTSTS